MRKFALYHFIALLLMLVVLLPMDAQAEIQLNSLATIGEEIYALQDNSLAMYDQTIKEFRLIDRTVPNNFILADSPCGIYIFSTAQQLLIELNNKAPYEEINRWQIHLPNVFQDAMLYRVVVINNELYLLTSDFKSDSFRGLWGYNLNTNQEAFCPIPSVQDMTWAWGDTLVIYSTPLGQKGGLYSWRINEEIAMLAAAPGSRDVVPGGLAYHVTTQMVYFQADGAIMSYDGQSLRATGYIMKRLEEEYSSAAVTTNDEYLLFFTDGIMNSFPMYAETQTVLSIAGSFDNETFIESYCALNPTIAITYTQDDPYNERSFAEALINRSLSADMIITSTSSTLYQVLLQKGNVLPLNQQAQLIDLITCMYPTIVEKVTLDGKYFALPFLLEEETIGYDPQLFEELRLDIPSTVEELLQLCMNTTLPNEVCLMNYPLSPLSDQLLQQIIDISFAQGMSTNVDVTQRLLQLWEQFSKNQKTQIDNAEKALFIPSFRILSENPNMQSQYYNPLVLSSADGQSPVVHASMKVIMIYAGTTKAEECLDFISYCANNLEPISRIALFPEENTPIKNEELEHQIQVLKNELELIEEAIEKEGNQTLYQRRKEIAAQLYRLEVNPWKISPEDIAMYREVAKHFLFTSDLYRYDTKNLQFAQLRDKLRQHQLSADGFLQKYLEIIRMMHLEE